jgi:hypothetical protein
LGALSLGAKQLGHEAVKLIETAATKRINI